MKTKAFLEYVESLKTTENTHILEAVQDAVLVIMVPDDELPIKNRFTLNKNKATNKADDSTDDAGIVEPDEMEASTVLLTQLAGNLFNTD